MKRLQLTIALMIALHAGTANAQQQTVRLSVPGFARPLVEKWVQEYSKTQPGVDFLWVNGQDAQGDGALRFVVADGTPSAKTVAVGKYAVLPVINKNSEAEQLLAGKSLNAKRLKSLFFLKDELDDDTPKESKAERAVHIYSGNSRQSASRAFAALFKQETTQFKGKKISGDDRFLNTALSRDPLGVTVNALPNLFDLGNRQLNASLAVVPLDVDKQSRQVLDSGSLDAVIQLLERQHFDAIAIGKVGAAYDSNDNRIGDFVRWILTDGRQYVHEYGLLQLPEKELTASLKQAGQKDLAQK